MKLIVCILGGIILTSPCFAWEPDPWGLYSFCEYHEFIIRYDVAIHKPNC